MTLLQKPLMITLGALIASGSLFAANSSVATAATSTTAQHTAVVKQVKPLHLSKVTIASHSVKLKWTVLKHATRYHVQYTRGSSFKKHTTKVTTAKQLTVAGLKNNATYHVRVVAWEHKHRLKISNVISVKTHAAVAPKPTSSTSPTTTPTSAPVVANLSAGLAGVPNGGTATLKNGTYSFSNFALGEGGTAGYDVPASIAKIQGAGVDKTVLEMKSNSSTKAGSVPTASSTTNQLSLLVTHGTSLSDLTLQGTGQGHLYNGLRVHRANNTKVTNVKVAAIPGNKNYPPGETFGINDYRTNGSVYNNLEVDGANVGAAGFGGNNSENITITNAYFHNNPYSAGITFWQSSNITLTDVHSENNHGAFNFERDAGTINIVRPEWKNIGNAHAFSFNSDQASAKVNIYDPVLPAGTSKIYILVAKSYLGVTNKQQRSDIHVYVKGKDVTSSMVVFAG
jgi:hypothetical protein